MPSLWKTDLCKYWERGGWCYNSLWCRYAHGTEELMPKEEKEEEKEEKNVALGYRDRLEEDEVLLTPLSRTDSGIISAIYKGAYDEEEMPSRAVMPLEYMNGLWHVATLSTTDSAIIKDKKPEPQPQPKAMPVSFGSENFNNYYF